MWLGAHETCAVFVRHIIRRRALGSGLVSLCACLKINRVYDDNLLPIETISGRYPTRPSLRPFDPFQGFHRAS
ncbi:hypothetical protein SCLCIDRAFT_1001598 [Scleroderma citrinum Foug A]|uniref:Uncharacterized protein n=1 Tax=Scleroderma citrinum Foug A TaxID=1036808 RepID=A0A0C3EJN1_9AGAM|nr:hypothetical protein SCLCIDRAFT_1001598 [Scleroderma citrinum Foug A]